MGACSVYFWILDPYLGDFFKRTLLELCRFYDKLTLNWRNQWSDDFEVKFDKQGIYDSTYLPLAFSFIMSCDCLILGEEIKKTLLNYRIARITVEI